MDNLKVILRQPATWIFIFAFLFAIFVSYEEDIAGKERAAWITDCLNLDGVPTMDEYSRGVGDSLCLEPNSIITVTPRAPAPAGTVPTR